MQVLAAALLCAYLSSTQARPHNASVTLDLSRRHPIAPTLFGIFFEEIGHAGEGGLYAELIQDRSFDALAAASGFATAAGDQYRLDLDLATLPKYGHLASDPILHPKLNDAVDPHQRASSHPPSNDIIIAWQPFQGSQLALNKEIPLKPGNPVAMEVTVGPGQQGGIVNLGYWGIAIKTQEAYALSLYIRNPSSKSIGVHVALVASDLLTLHANLTLEASPSNTTWLRYTGELRSAATDTDARLVVSFPGPATLLFDSVSLFPKENVEAAREKGMANPWPFRPDLLQALKDLKPGFIRFPGGCYVEGDWMRNAFMWKRAVGLNEDRPGHMNGVWGYWSTDGLGLFEYLLLAEELGAEPVWVLNNGVAHADSVPASDVLPLVRDALDSIEFVTGPPDSTWGAVRAAMGHPEPWSLNYVAIGNEDCGKPFYVQNYNLFYGALSAAYPHLRLISNCDMGADAPTDIWDWHVYTNPRAMFDLRTAFDGRNPRAGHLVFASEYAVTDGGGYGNLIGAVAEAAFMTGLERNGEAVPLAAYAPLFVHWNNRPWPTNMIVIDNHRWFGIPSYHVQRLFRETQGVQYIDTQVEESPQREVHEDTIAASATCQDEDCDEVVIKVINFSSFPQAVKVAVKGGRRVRPQGQLLVLTSDHPEDENSFDEPLKVAPVGSELDSLAETFMMELLPWSVNAMRLTLDPAPSMARLGGGRGGTATA